MYDAGYGAEYDAGYDCECGEWVPEPAMPYPAPAAVIPPPAVTQVVEVAPLQPPSWRERHRKLVLLVGGGLLFPALLAGVAIGLAYLLRRELLWTRLVTFGPQPWRLLWAIPLALSTVIGLHLLTKLVPAIERALKESGANDHQETIRLLGYPGMLLLVITSGFGEEILFRGALQPTLTIPVAAFLFGFAHGGWQRRMWAYVVAATLAGCAYGLVYWQTHLLWLCMLGHALHNTLSVALAGKKIDLEFDGWRPRLQVRPEEKS